MGRERFLSIINNKKADRPGLWLGEPLKEEAKRMFARYGVEDRLGLSRAAKEDFTMLQADNFFGLPRPDGRRVLYQEHPHIFADCEDVQEVYDSDFIAQASEANIDWTRLEHALDVSRADDIAATCGTWSAFFHEAADLFGMENYFVKMYTDPDVVHAVTERLVNYHMQMNEIIFTRMKGKIDAFFMGNDFGTQLDLFVSPELFREFILPYIKKLADHAHSHGLPVLQHSCGSIYRVIPDLIAAGIDGLHPLQALAKGMDAESLAQYKDDIAFIGGIDAQHLLQEGTPDDIRREVKRIHKIFGSNWIVSPSHEAYNTDVPVENIVAICEAVEEL